MATMLRNSGRPLEIDSRRQIVATEVMLYRLSSSQPQKIGKTMTIGARRHVIGSRIAMKQSPLKKVELL